MSKSESIKKVSLVDPDSLLAHAERVLASTDPERAKQREAIESAQRELQPTVEAAERALSELQGLLRKHERALSTTSQIDFRLLQRRPGVSDKFRVRIERTERVVRDTQRLVGQLQDRLLDIPRRVASIRYEDLRPMNFIEESWNGNRAGVYPMEVGRIRRHVWQSARDVALLPQRFEEVTGLVGELAAGLAKLGPAPEIEAGNIRDPREIEAVKSDSRAPKQTEYADFNPYQR